MRGAAFIVAVTVVAEVGDFQRFDNPRQLMGVDSGRGQDRITRHFGGGV